VVVAAFLALLVIVSLFGTLDLAIGHPRRLLHLNKREVAAMIRGGSKPDSHTITHAHLPRVRPAPSRCGGRTLLGSLVSAGSEPVTRLTKGGVQPVLA
jgi:hypothetical protein